NIQYSNVKGLLNYLPNAKHDITAGFAVTRYDINPGTLNQNIVSAILPVDIEKEQGVEFSAFFDDVMKVNSALDIQYGLRVVNYHFLGPTTLRNYQGNEQPSEGSFLNSESITGSAASYWNIEPRLTVRYLINNRSSLKFGYNRMGQFLQLISNSITPLPTARWKLSDNNIKPQTGDFATLGYFLDWGRGVWGFSAEAYFRQTENLLDYTSGANLQLNPTIETQLLAGTGRAYGLELMVTKKKGSTTGWLSYTYSRSLQNLYATSTDTDTRWYPTIYDKPHGLNVILSTQTDKHNTFGFVFALNSGRPFTSPTGTYLLNGQSYPLYVDRNNDRTPTYHRFDLSWTIDNPSMRERRWEGSWVFTVYNLYSQKNVYSIFFLNSSRGVQAYSLSVFATPLLSLTYNFKFR
ncbi:MAG: TonB-dependent receptor, partial [Spirosomaceae bacterium]|nr:TonB-dependent receptor [Spirosomataceae bacterium]